MAKKIDYQINTGSSNERNVLFLRDRYQKLAGLNILSALVLSPAAVALEVVAAVR